MKQFALSQHAATLISGLLISTTLGMKTAPLSLGTFHGIGPSVDSPMTVGEYIAEFSETKLTLKIATGSSVKTSRETITYTPMSKIDIASLLGSSYVDLWNDDSMFYKINNQCPCLMFTNSSDAKEAALYILYSSESTLGKSIGLSAQFPITPFYSRTQVRDPIGTWKQILDEYGTTLPRIEYGGYTQSTASETPSGYHHESQQ